MHFTTLFQLTALAALLDPILAQLWNISAYETDTCAQTSLFFEEVRMDANLDNPCYSFGTLAKSAQIGQVLALTFGLPIMIGSMKEGRPDSSTLAIATDPFAVPDEEGVPDKFAINGAGIAICRPSRWRWSGRYSLLRPGTEMEVLRQEVLQEVQVTQAFLRHA
ncbi:hypothetical protein Q9189_004806 [Teloschistes chrysophthalmus]